MKRLLPVILLIFSASCQQRMYFPDRAVAPGLREQYEAKLALSLKAQSRGGDEITAKGGKDYAFDGDFCFAPAAHIGLFVSYRGLNHRLISEDSGLLANVYGGNFNGHRWEGGVGYFSKLEDGISTYEVYGGYGNGSISRRGYYTPYKDYDVRYHRFFVQAGMGSSFREIMNFSGGMRLAAQRYYNFSSPTGGDSLRYYVARDGYTDITKQTMAFFEPYINYEVGYKWVKFNLQWGLSTQITGDNVVGRAPMYLTGGFVFSLAPRYLLPDAQRAPSKPKRIRYRRGDE